MPEISASVMLNVLPSWNAEVLSKPSQQVLLDGPLVVSQNRSGKVDISILGNPSSRPVCHEAEQEEMLSVMLQSGTQSRLHYGCIPVEEQSTLCSHRYL